MDVDDYGRPLTLTANSNGDGDGGSATPFLPRNLFSTEFVAPTAFTYAKTVFPPHTFCTSVRRIIFAKTGSGQT
jgi:hypothetical protein